LASNAECILDYGISGEACPLGLAPTTSTTVMLALGDALSMVVAKVKDLRPQDFARSHPGGSLGKKLSNVTEIMRPISECRVASSEQTVREIYIQLAGPSRRSGAVLLVDENDWLVGIFTDSDLARLLERQQDKWFDKPVAEVMTRKPTCVTTDTKTQLAVEILASINISELPVVDKSNKPVGLIDITDVVGLFPVEK
jgi:arabinose-5-phosphate isomerase